MLAAGVPLSVPEAAAIVNLSPFAVFMRIRMGQLEAHRETINGRYLIPAEAVREAIGPKLNAAG